MILTPNSTAELRVSPNLVTGNPFVTYVYSYPHKTAHRPIRPAIPLTDVWAAESQSALFLYFHIPFCQSRCGFCNLFSLARPDSDLPGLYLEQVRRQAERVRRAIGDPVFSRLAIGGGTPTFLAPDQLERLFTIAKDVLGVRPREIPISVEASPGSLRRDKLEVLREHSVDRLSLGIQIFDEQDAYSLGRPQNKADVYRALELVRRAAIPVLNVDLIYGVPGQSVGRWLATVTDALRYRPEEFYLYPLYVRPLTGLGRRDGRWEDTRLVCYREARALLLEAGYRQLSLRMFRAESAPAEEGPVYRCQEDGMVGLGCGARSYTRKLHYSTPYAVPRRAVREVLESFLRRSPDDFAAASHGIPMDCEDQRRRYVILSLLQTEGMSRADYERRFETEALADLPQLRELQKLGLMTVSEDHLRLTAAGVERSDAIGPWLFSEKVRRLMESYQWRVT
jgi:oxygen-independent coproporphyrinogen-3 oxidase